MKVSSIALVFLFCASITFANEKGNGGDAVVCFQTNATASKVQATIEQNRSTGTRLDPLGNGVAAEITQVDLLDLYEASLRRLATPSYQLIRSNADFPAIFQERLDLVASKDPRFANVIRTQASAIPMDRWLGSRSGVIEINDDSSRVLVPQNCLVLQVAVQVNDGAPRIYFNETLFEKMNHVNQAALIMHEYLYRDQIQNWGETDSTKARLINASLFDEHLASMTPAEANRAFGGRDGMVEINLPTGVKWYGYWRKASQTPEVILAFPVSFGSLLLPVNTVLGLSSDASNPSISFIVPTDLAVGPFHLKQGTLAEFHDFDPGLPKTITIDQPILVGSITYPAGSTLTLDRQGKIISASNSSGALLVQAEFGGKNYSCYFNFSWPVFLGANLGSATTASDLYGSIQAFNSKEGLKPFFETGEQPYHEGRLEYCMTRQAITGKNFSTVRTYDSISFLIQFDHGGRISNMSGSDASLAITEYYTKLLRFSMPLRIGKWRDMNCRSASMKFEQTDRGEHILRSCIADAPTYVRKMTLSGTIEFHENGAIKSGVLQNNRVIIGRHLFRKGDLIQLDESETVIVPRH